MRDLKIISDTELKLNEIKHITHTINSFSKDIIVVTGQNKLLATHHTLKDGSHAYTFDFKRSVSNTEADNIIGGLYSTLKFDFIAEIEAELSGDEDEDSLPDFDETSMVIEHTQWLAERINNGWSYGKDYSESQKKNPFMLPFYRLSDRQVKVMEHSKEKLGKYGLHEDFIHGLKMESEKVKIKKSELRKALKEDQDVYVDYNEYHNAYCVLGDNSNHCYGHSNDQSKANLKLEKVKSYMVSHRKK